MEVQTFFDQAARLLVDPENSKNESPKIAWGVTIILGTFMLGVPQILGGAWRYFRSENEENMTHKKVAEFFSQFFDHTSEKKEEVESPQKGETEQKADSSVKVTSSIRKESPSPVSLQEELSLIQGSTEKLVRILVFFCQI